MATTAAAQTNEHEKYAINPPGYKKGVNEKTHIVQIDVLLPPPPSARPAHGF